MYYKQPNEKANASMLAPEDTGFDLVLNLYFLLFKYILILWFMIYICILFILP